MKKIVLTYGLISGAIVASLILLSVPLWNKGILTFDNGQLVGYSTMVISLSVIFIAIKSYRDNYAGGTISFWGGAKIGLLISLISAVMYSLAWEIALANMSTDFIAKMTEHYFQEMKSNAATEADLLKARQSWDEFMVWYKVPFVRFAITLTEILPVGIVITLISAALLRKKEFLPATKLA